MFGVCHVLVLVVLFGQGFCLAWGVDRRRLGGAFGSVRRIGTLGQGYVQGVKHVAGCEVDPGLGFGGMPSTHPRPRAPPRQLPHLAAFAPFLLLCFVVTDPARVRPVHDTCWGFGRRRAAAIWADLVIARATGSVRKGRFGGMPPLHR